MIRLIAPDGSLGTAVQMAGKFYFPCESRSPDGEGLGMTGPNTAVDSCLRAELPIQRAAAKSSGATTAAQAERNSPKAGDGSNPSDSLTLYQPGDWILILEDRRIAVTAAHFEAIWRGRAVEKLMSRGRIGADARVSPRTAAPNHDLQSDLHGMAPSEPTPKPVQPVAVAENSSCKSRVVALVPQGERATTQRGLDCRSALTD